MRWLSKLFNITESEGPQVFLLFFLLVLGQVGNIWGATTAQAAFLSQVGLGALPWVTAIGALVLILGTAIYTAFVDRVSSHKLLIFLYFLLTVGIVLTLVLIRVGQSWVAYPLLYLIFFALGFIVDAHFMAYFNSLFDIQAAKRVLPVIFAGGRVGVIAGGFTLRFLNDLILPETIIAVWLLINILAMGLLWLMPYLLLKKKTGGAETRSVAPVNRTSSYISDMQEGSRYVIQSAYLRWIVLAALMVTILMTLANYKTTELLLENTASTAEYSSYIAMLQAIGNAIVLPILLFGLSRLIAWLGLGTASLIFPSGNLLFSAGLVFAPGLVSATAAFMDQTAFRSVFQFPIEGLFYNAVPIKLRGRARAFVGGLVVPLSMILSSVLLILPLVKTAWFVSGLILLLSVSYLVVSYFVRREYSRALVKMLEEEDYSFLLSQQASELPMADPVTLNRLQQKLHESTNHELTVFMTQLIAQIGGRQAITILEPAIKGVTEGRTRSAMLDVLTASGLREERVKDFYIQFLADSDGWVRQSAIAGLENISGASDRQFCHQMLKMIDDPDINVCSRALLALGNSGNFYQFGPAVQALDRMVDDPDADRRANGVRVLGKIGHSQALNRLVKYLGDPVDSVRLEAAVALEDLSQSYLPDLKILEAQNPGILIEKVSAILHDPVERVRQAALVILGRVVTSGEYDLLIGALTDPSPRIRETAIDVLTRMGKAVIPAIHSRLNSPDPQLRKMAIVILSRIKPNEFGGLIVGESIMGNLLTVYRNYGLSDALGGSFSELRSIASLRNALGERSDNLADEIFYLLSAIHQPASVKIIRESLESEDPNVRANAAEALEALTTPQISKLIAPLFNPDLPVDSLLAISQESWDMKRPEATGALRQLSTNPEDNWLRAMAIFSLGDIGTAMSAASNPKPAPPAPVETPTPRSRPGRKPASLDLLGALSDDSSNAKSKSSSKEVQTGNEIPPQSAEQTPTDAALSAEIAGLAFSMPQIESLLDTALADKDEEVHNTAKVARKKIKAGSPTTPLTAADQDGAPALGNNLSEDDASMLSTIERIIFLKEVPFFKDMTIDQLKVLASVCEEQLFPAGTRIFKNGDDGGILYVVVNGQVGIEQEKRPGFFARLANVGAYSYFGEANFFDASKHSTSAVTTQDTKTLQLRREPLIELARQNPELALELINVLSQRLRENSDRIAELTRSRPRELHNLFDQFE